MSNALKFTRKGIVELGLKRTCDNLAFYVKDTGIGIKEKDIETIFERFRKGEGDKNVLYRGVGLGLAISKALAQLMGGSLVVESEFGKGSVFTLLLPDVLINNEGLVVPEIPVLVEKGTMSGKNILVVEDENDNYLYMKSVLTKTNLNVYHAKNGIEALRMLESGITMHLILMDIKMPEMDGFEAAKIIKSKKPNQLVIAVTAFARPEEKLKFMDAGFDDYITKPVKPDELGSVINKYL